MQGKMDESSWSRKSKIQMDYSIRLFFNQSNTERRKKMGKNFQIDVKHSHRAYGKESIQFFNQKRT